MEVDERQTREANYDDAAGDNGDSDSDSDSAIDESASEALRLWCEMMAVGDDSDRVTDIEVDERGERWAHYTRVADSRGEYWADSSNDGCSSSSSSSNNSSSSDEADDGQGTAESGRCGPAAAGPVRNGT